ESSVSSSSSESSVSSSASSVLPMPVTETATTRSPWMLYALIGVLVFAGVFGAMYFIKKLNEAKADQ
ncbi:MAG: hypothetical protein PHE68_06275, partial [Candidatus Peribacteraceae bacterium]|nr:hypothetical protein [Candidatus Peribacteraceae bacterium]MDD5075424.1 hypothetical protein [Candidatus Peribacteraceae bacterium]